MESESNKLQLTVVLHGGTCHHHLHTVSGVGDTERNIMVDRKEYFAFVLKIHLITKLQRINVLNYYSSLFIYTVVIYRLAKANISILLKKPTNKIIHIIIVLFLSIAGIL